MTRREARELAFILLFEMTFTGDPIRILYENAAEARDVENDAFALSLAEGAAAHLDEEDEQISAFSRKWNKDRLSRVALSIMRLAIYEMEFEPDIPVSVSIRWRFLHRRGFFCNCQSAISGFRRSLFPARCKRTAGTIPM